VCSVSCALHQTQPKRIEFGFRDLFNQPSIDPQRSLRLDGAPPGPCSRTTSHLRGEVAEVGTVDKKGHAPKKNSLLPP
jgi:hypothetical protein